jgi:hypothetical protein
MATVKQKDDCKTKWRLSKQHGGCKNKMEALNTKWRMQNTDSVVYLHNF